MSSYAKCPYCGAAVEICHDDGHGMDEGELYQEYCYECEKAFVFATRIILNYTTYKADCLNGGEHDYQKTITSPPECARMRCTMCGDEIPMPEVRVR